MKLAESLGPTARQALGITILRKANRKIFAVYALFQAQNQEEFQETAS